MIENGYEIDFIPVNSGERNGDAIAIRVRDNNVDTIYVIDGGTKESGQTLVDHIKENYNTNKVDYLINTHPDIDHSSGLTVVAEQLEIGEIWMHLPWDHAGEIIRSVLDKRVSENSLTRKLQKSLTQAKNLFDIAQANGIPIYEPFEGDSIGHFQVLSPSRNWYNELLLGFNNMPTADQETALGTIMKSVKETIRKVLENWNVETLTEDGETSPQNESSCVLFGTFQDQNVLFTGDAGIQALTRSIEYSQIIGIDLKQCHFVQIPHHGGRRNITPSILDEIIGPKLSQAVNETKSAYANISDGNSTHPKKSVSNAFKRRGAEVYVTKGIAACHRKNFGTRSGWSNATSLPLFNEVEE